MKRLALTTHREKVLDYIRRSLETGLSPTREEIRHHCRFQSPNAVTYHLSRLIREGYVTVKEGLARGIQLTQKSSGIPILGRVPAGAPIEAFENVEGYVGGLTGSSTQKLFALRVKGDSMVGEHIAEGDVVIVRLGPEVRQGDVVVARIQEEITIKQFRRKGNRSYLCPANPRYKPLLIDEHVQIVGKVIRVQRDYQ